VILRHGVLAIKRVVDLAGLGEAVQAEGRLDHILGHRADHSLGLLARLEESNGRDARDPE